LIDSGQGRIDEFVGARFGRILLQIGKDLKNRNFAIVQVRGVLLVESVLKKPVDGFFVGFGERCDPLIFGLEKTGLGGIGTDVS
jgi:hypothetical protein